MIEQDIQEIREKFQLNNKYNKHGYTSQILREYKFKELLDALGERDREVESLKQQLHFHANVADGMSREVYRLQKENILFQRSLQKIVTCNVIDEQAWKLQDIARKALAGEEKE